MLGIEHEVTTSSSILAKLIPAWQAKAPLQNSKSK
jgi:hypothetical protein